MKKWLLIIGIGILVLVVGLVIGLTVFTKHLGRMTVEEALYFASDHFRIEYTRQTDNSAAGTKIYRGIRIRPKIHSRLDLDIDECVLALTPGSGPRDLPQRLKVRLSGVRPRNPEKVENLARLGYEDFSLEAQLDLEVWPEKKRIAVRELSLVSPGAGSLFGYLALNGLEIDLDTTLKQIPGLLDRALLGLIELGYEDDSLVRRLIQAEAREEGKTPDQVLEEAVAHLRRKAEEEKDAVKARTLMVMSEFIRQPGTLTAKAEPSRPVTLGDVREFKKISQGEWPEAMNLVITTD